MNCDLRFVDVKMEHMDLLFDWVNESECRKNSFYSEKIEYNNHKQWLLDKLNDKTCRMYLLVNSNEYVGQVRVEVQRETGLIGYSIKKEFRGYGYGCEILHLLEDKLKSVEGINVKYLVGKVKKDNIASQKVFKKLSYIEEIKEGYIIYTKNIES